MIGLSKREKIVGNQREHGRNIIGYRVGRIISVSVVRLTLRLPKKVGPSISYHGVGRKSGGRS
jgi:hypothetical protein